MMSWSKWEPPQHGWRILWIASLICGPLRSFSVRRSLTDVKGFMCFPQYMFTRRYLMSVSALFDDHWRQSGQFKSPIVDADEEHAWSFTGTRTKTCDGMHGAYKLPKQHSKVEKSGRLLSHITWHCFIHWYYFRKACRLYQIKQNQARRGTEESCKVIFKSLEDHSKNMIVVVTIIFHLYWLTTPCSYIDLRNCRQ